MIAANDANELELMEGVGRRVGGKGGEDEASGRVSTKDLKKVREWTPLNLQGLFNSGYASELSYTGMKAPRYALNGCYGCFCTPSFGDGNRPALLIFPRMR